MFLGWGFSIFVWHKEQNRNILHASVKSHSLWLKEQVLENTGLFCNSQCSHLLILWITCSLLFPERLKQSVKVLPKNMQQILQVTNWKRTGKSKKTQPTIFRYQWSKHPSSIQMRLWGRSVPQSEDLDQTVLPLICDVAVHCCLQHWRCWQWLLR